VSMNVHGAIDLEAAKTQTLSSALHQRSNSWPRTEQCILLALSRFFPTMCAIMIPNSARVAHQRSADTKRFNAPVGRDGRFAFLGRAIRNAGRKIARGWRAWRSSDLDDPVFALPFSVDRDVGL
jgi:hypothetical protein